MFPYTRYRVIFDDVIDNATKRKEVKKVLSLKLKKES